MKSVEARYENLLAAHCGDANKARAYADSANILLSDRLEHLQKGLADPTLPVFIRCVPDAAFHAAVTRAGNAYLIIVFSGLIELCMRAAYLAASIAHVEQAGKLIPNDWVVSDASNEWALLMDEARRGLLPTRRMSPLSRARGVLCEMVFGNSVDFAIAHELGHIQEGHHSSVAEMELVSTWSYTWTQEMEADACALRIATASYGSDPRRTSLMSVGAAFLFELADALAYNSSEDEVHWRDVQLEGFLTHPPASARRGALLAGPSGDGVFADFTNAASIIEAVRSFTRSRDMNIQKNAAETSKSYADKLSADVGRELDVLLKSGQAERGITYFEPVAIFEWLSADHERARGAVSMVAIGYLRFEKMGGAVFGTHLGLMAMLYRAAFQDGPYAREVSAFNQLLGHAIPEMPKLLAEFDAAWKLQFGS